MRRHSEQPFCPRKGICVADASSLRGRQVEKVSEGIWDAEQVDPDWTSRWGTGVARQPLGKRETVMRPLGTREDGRRWCWRRQGLLKRHVHALAAHELHAGAPMLSAAPVPPKQGSRGD